MATVESTASALFCDAGHVVGTSDIAGLEFECGESSNDNIG